MSTLPGNPQADPIQAAYDQGRRAGLATAAFALSMVAFLNLLGIEKSILAMVLALLALRGAGSFRESLGRGRAAIVIGAIHALTVVVAVVLLRDKFKELVQLWHSLS